MMTIIGSKCHGRVMVTGRWEPSDSPWVWVSFTEHLCNCNDVFAVGSLGRGDGVLVMVTILMAPCGLQGCKNRPAPFLGSVGPLS